MKNDTDRHRVGPPQEPARLTPQHYGLHVCPENRLSLFHGGVSSLVGETPRWKPSVPRELLKGRSAARWLVCLTSLTIILSAAVISSPEARSATDDPCTAVSGAVQSRLRCALWQVLACLRPTGRDLLSRETGRVALESNQWGEVETRTRSLRSPWPDCIILRISKEGGTTEEVVDQSLNGLRPDDPLDAYRIEGESSKPKDLLEGMDPPGLAQLNDRYYNRIQSILKSLQKRKVHDPVQWRSLGNGLEFGHLIARRHIRYGENRIVLVRVDPRHYDFVPFSHQEPEHPGPAAVERWAGLIPDAAVIFNAGQYYPDGGYIGLLIKNGQPINPERHPVWKALLVSGKSGGRPDLPPTDILDLCFHTFDPQSTPYGQVIQSFMLLDQRGQTRVRRSTRLASRTVVAQDHSGRIILLLVPGACTLYELALLLKESELGIKRAMSMDGGFESQLLVRDNDEEHSFHGGWVVNETRQFHHPRLMIPLPAVIAVVPRNRSRP